jgi:hypothetical protein
LVRCPYSLSKDNNATVELAVFLQGEEIKGINRTLHARLSPHAITPKLDPTPVWEAIGSFSPTPTIAGFNRVKQAGRLGMSAGSAMTNAGVDYYEFLQISPKADTETIHRVYRFLAARLHPDNSSTGNAEQFQLLKAAYDVLSDPLRRAMYDASRIPAPAKPLSTTIDFMDHMDGELNRRLAVLAVLYYRRRSNPTYPEVPLNEIEERMGFPRDYLDFTLWYLTRKGYIVKEDNAQCTLTVEGVDFVEANRANFPTLNKLLTSGSGSSIAETMQVLESEVRVGSTPIILHSSADHLTDRRTGPADRRVGAPDLRIFKVERRKSSRDRRANVDARQGTA